MGRAWLRVNEARAGAAFATDAGAHSLRTQWPSVLELLVLLVH